MLKHFLGTRFKMAIFPVSRGKNLRVPQKEVGKRSSNTIFFVFGTLSVTFCQGHVPAEGIFVKKHTFQKWKVHIYDIRPP